MHLKIVAIVSALAVFGGCAGWQKSLKDNAKKPHPMEAQFGHVLFNQSPNLYPSLEPAAPSTERTPRRAAEGELRPGDLEIVNANQTDPAKDTPLYQPKTTRDGTAIASTEPSTKPADTTGSALSSGATGVVPQPTVEEAPAATVPTVPKRPKAPKPTDDRGLTIEELPVETPEKPPAGLGDGSVASELIAASQRLIGVDTEFDERTFLVHLLQVADVEVKPGAGEDLVKAVYEKLNATDHVYGPSHHPKAGDLVFFHNTRDRDEDGRADDWFTMAGVVERIDGDGTITFVGYARGAIRRMYMNLTHPTIARESGTDKTWNSMVRGKRLEDRPFTAYLSGELFAAFGRVK